MVEYAKTPDDLKKIVDDLQKAIDIALATTTPKALSEADSKIRTVFRGIDMNLRSVATETRRKVDAHLVDIRHGRVEQPDNSEKAKEVAGNPSEGYEVGEQPAEETKKTVKRRYTKKAKK